MFDFLNRIPSKTRIIIAIIVTLVLVFIIISLLFDMFKTISEDENSDDNVLYVKVIKDEDSSSSKMIGYILVAAAIMMSTYWFKSQMNETKHKPRMIFERKNKIDDVLKPESTPWTKACSKTIRKKQSKDIDFGDLIKKDINNGELTKNQQENFKASYLPGPQIIKNVQKLPPQLSVISDQPPVVKKIEETKQKIQDEKDKIPEEKVIEIMKKTNQEQNEKKKDDKPKVIEVKSVPLDKKKL